jgi:hypothetical protein
MPLFNNTKKKSKPKLSASKKLEYPYYRYIYIPNKRRCFQLAASVSNKIETLQPSGEKVIIDDWKRNMELNQLTDIFTENCRVRCQFLGHTTPLEYWGKHVKYNPTKPLKFYRELIYRETKLCNNFRISLVISILKMFNARRWLDISAGWGDRLLGAILSPKLEYYCGVDPNPCVQAGYRKILDFFFKDDPSSRKKYNLIQDGFETAQLPTGKSFDLVFSSPPFFDLETYSDSSSNSLTSFNTEEKWLNGFLLPSIKKAAAILESNGHLVLYITESKTTSYIPKMLEGVRKQIPNLEYQGKMYYRDAGSTKSKLRDFHVWSKKKLL